MSFRETLHMSGSFDAVLLDSAGNVKTDTKKERIEARKAFAFLALKHRANPIALSLLESYKASLTDRNNALVHLYEIRDALATKFGGETNACSALGLTSNQWSRLGYLANDAPLSQGGHRGKKIGEIRDAIPAELDEARTIAREMIQAYLDHLERTNPRRQP